MKKLKTTPDYIIDLSLAAEDRWEDAIRKTRKGADIVINEALEELDQAWGRKIIKKTVLGAFFSAVSRCWKNG